MGKDKFIVVHKFDGVEVIVNTAHIVRFYAGKIGSHIEMSNEYVDMHIKETTEQVLKLVNN